MRKCCRRTGAGLEVEVAVPAQQRTVGRQLNLQCGQVARMASLRLVTVLRRSRVADLNQRDECVPEELLAVPQMRLLVLQRLWIMSARCAMHAARTDDDGRCDVELDLAVHNLVPRHQHLHMLMIAQQPARMPARA